MSIEPLQILRMRRSNPVERLSVTTCKGLALDLVQHEDGEEVNRGFTYDIVEAFHQGARIGYLNAGYIPKQKLALFYPKPHELLHYAQQMGGSYYGIKDFSDANLLRVAQEHGMTSLEEFNERLKERYAREYRKFIAWNVDKPKVDYIKVHEDFQRRGVATELYAQAFRHYTKKGLPFFASTLQSDEAQLTWEHLCKNGFQTRLTRDKRLEVVGVPPLRELAVGPEL